MTLRLILSWVLGGILISIGAWIIGHAEESVGVSLISYGMALFVGFILILIGGFAWISVATATAKH